MRKKLEKSIPILICLLLCVIFGAFLLIYARPMEDATLDLSLIDKSSATATETLDEKGWEVYTREGDVITELEPDGRGFYFGIELGQTLYLSRVLEENMDAPTLQIGSADRTFVVFLDDQVIYSDHPGQDSRIGYLSLPMGDYREDPVVITLPAGYQGKTLTIAQSTPPFAEGSQLKAAPASVILHCGYAYESGIISESYSLAITAAALFAVGMLLLVAFVRRRDWSLLCIALDAFLAMCILLNDVSFRFRYFGSTYNYHWYLRWLAALSLLAFLTLKAGSHKRLPQVLRCLYTGVFPAVCPLSQRSFGLAEIAVPHRTRDPVLGGLRGHNRIGYEVLAQREPFLSGVCAAAPHWTGRVLGCCDPPRSQHSPLIVCGHPLRQHLSALPRLSHGSDGDRLGNCPMGRFAGRIGVSNGKASH